MSQTSTFIHGLQQLAEKQQLSADFGRFLRHFYADRSSEDFAKKTPQQWVDEAKAHYEKAGQTAVSRAREIERGWDEAAAAAYETELTAAYRERFTPEDALADMEALQALENGTLAVRFGRQPEDTDAPLWLKMYFDGKSPSLSRTLPIIENLGFSVFAEEVFVIRRRGGGTAGLSHFALSLKNPAWDKNFDDETVRKNLAELLRRVWRGKTENDSFNALVLAADTPRIGWRDTVLVRALAKYLKQVNVPFGQQYIEQCLLRYGKISSLLTGLFHARLDPAQTDDAGAEKLQAALDSALSGVQNLDDDRIIRALRSVVLAVVRTNFWQKDASGSLKEEIALKIRSGEIDFLPQPRPLFETWVYSPRVEGVHLRATKVARGGLRWSDRFEDFRTEILGLLKAQMVKNSVIVPHGAKGGFVCKQLPEPSAREAYGAEGVACYKIFVNALLDIADNLQNGTVVAPQGVRRRDGDDPYLVVAADKGTARFSDTANQISRNHGFWLDDAFASGGSAGYDHKGMGITARGAWESVKRHFRHLGKDIQNEDFTVVGIGDMGGDVFGNGMLLSRHILLKAAFNHRHIFLDPDPDAEKSYAERERLFQAVSGWDGYNRALISQGGGVFERGAKSITLSPEIKSWLKITADEIAPEALIHELLKAEVDLIYNGGIGTYIKASHETHEQVKDRANDRVRVDGRDIRAKVVGEGGNLGATQQGRIEYCLNGGLCCTDAIDNSAGVDCSDHEVNIKILLGGEVQKGRITGEERDALLKSMTDSVAKLVLRDNYLQTQVLAMNRLDAHQFLNAHAELILYLREHAGLSRTLEFLPKEAEIRRRDAEHIGLTAPEVAVLMAYAKIHCKSELLAGGTPDDPAFEEVLTGYFPAELHADYADAMKNHFLRREIVANCLANRVINRMGVSFVQRFSTEMGASVADVVRAYWLADKIFDGEARFLRLEALDNQIPADSQMQLMGSTARLLSRVARRILRNGIHTGDMAQTAEHYRAAVAALLQRLPETLAAEDYADIAAAEEKLRALNVFSEEEIALNARLNYAENSLQIIGLAEETQKDAGEVLQQYFQEYRALELDWLYRAVAALPRQNLWQNQAYLAVREDVQNLHRRFTHHALAAQSDSARAALQNAHENARRQIHMMQNHGQPDLAMLMSLVRTLAAA